MITMAEIEERMRQYNSGLDKAIEILERFKKEIEIKEIDGVEEAIEEIKREKVEINDDGC